METENKNKLSSSVPIFLVYLASQTRAKINKMSICRYHKDAIINCVFKIIPHLVSLLFN